jgi:hypothetical protein
LKEDDHDLGNEQQDEATIPGLYEVINSFSNEEDIEKNPGMHKARSDEDVEEFEDEDGKEESESDEEEMPRDMSDEQDTDNASEGDEAALNNDDLLNEVGFAQL